MNSIKCISAIAINRSNAIFMKSSNSCTVTRVQFSKFSVKKDNDSGLTSLLDVGTAVFHNSEDGKSRRRASGKLRKSLDSSTKKPVLDIASEGHLDTIGAYVMDSINESLASPNLSGMFRGVKDISDAIEILEVKCNRDCSHATVVWECEVLNKFVRFHFNSVKSLEKSRLLAQKLGDKLNSKLQQSEPFFRSKLMRNMHFRRVPRILFHPKDKFLSLPKPNDK